MKRKHWGEDRGARTEQGQIGGGEKRSGRLVGAAETSKEGAEWRRLQRKSLNILGLQKRKSGLSATEKAVGKYAATTFAKKKRNRAVSPEYQIMSGGESKWAGAALW